MTAHSVTISEVDTQLKVLELDTILSIEDVYYYTDILQTWLPQRFPSAAVTTPKAT